MLNKIIKNVFLGIVFGEFILNMVLFIGAIIIGDSFFDFTSVFYIKSFIASALVGIGFFVPSIVYSNDKLSRGMQILIHMGIGFIIYIPTGFFVGWFPTQGGIYTIILLIILIIIISITIWFGFYLYYKNEAKKINKKIKQKNN